MLNLKSNAPPTPLDAQPSDARNLKEMQGILWLASYPKSGNTWTRNFLHNLLNILEGIEEDEQDINGMNELTFWEMSADRYETLLEKPVVLCTREEIAAVRPKVQALLAEKVDGLTMIKTHHCLVVDRGTPAINTAVSVGAVYIVRNPLDVAISLANHISGTIDDAIDMMATEGLETPVTEKSVYEVYGSWSQHVDSWTHKPHRTVYVMRYEDMLREPMQVFGALARHLLLKPRPEQLRLAIERSSFDVLKKQEDEYGFREKPERAERFFRSGKSGEWQEKLARRQVREIVRVHHRQMARFSYLTDDLKPLARGDV